MKDSYSKNTECTFKVGDKATWNRKIFKECPFKNDNVKTIKEIKTGFIGLEKERIWWAWWELVPTKRSKKLLYWVKFYIWYIVERRK